MKTIFTIGYAGAEFENVCRLLAAHGASRIVDVRSMPYSKKFPKWNREAMEQYSEYVWMGEALGARQEDAVVGGAVSRDAVWEKREFRDAAESLPGNAVLLCAEKDPAECHRALLIGEYLFANGLADVVHVTPEGDEPHADMCRRLRGKYGLMQGSLLGDDENQRKMALARAWKEIAWVPEDPMTMRPR